MNGGHIAGNRQRPRLETDRMGRLQGHTSRVLTAVFALMAAATSPPPLIGSGPVARQL